MYLLRAKVLIIGYMRAKDALFHIFILYFQLAVLFECSFMILL